MEAIRQLLITWMLVALFVTNSVGKNPFLRPGSTPPERTPSLPSWSDFTYNSLEEQTFWDGLPDFSDHASFEQPFYRHAKINALGELTYKNPNEGFNGYVKLKSKYFLGRIIYQYADGYRIRSKSWY